jgi:shikimate dehydrogenase
VPHKVNAMKLMDELTPAARFIAAINTIVVRPDGSLLGANNDGIGYIQSLRDANPAWRGDAGSALVLGAGGAARAIVVGLLEEGAPEVRIANRTLERAQALADAFGSRVTVVPWSERNDAMADVKLLVNTTTQGMHGQPALDVQLDGLPANAMVSDAIYIPLETPLLHQARLRGHVTVNGLGMLLNQAVPAFEAWFGVRPQVTPELRAVVQATF